MQGKALERRSNMIFPRPEMVSRLRSEYPKGTRVRLVKMYDSKAPAPGTCGTVLHVDDMGTIYARWDNGSCLGVVYEVDRCEKIGGTK